MEDVETRGPMFDGRADAELDRAVHEIRVKVADDGLKMVRGLLLDSIRDNRGVYISRTEVIEDSHVFVTRGKRKTYTIPVVADRSTEDVVTVDLATYGPWIEGTGSRNETTRFKGYHAFRRASQQLELVAERVADDAIKPYIEEMNH